MDKIDFFLLPRCTDLYARAPFFRDIPDAPCMGQLPLSHTHVPRTHHHLPPVIVMAQIPSDTDHARYVAQVRAVVQDVTGGVHEGFRLALLAQRRATLDVANLLVLVITKYDGPGHIEIKIAIRFIIDALLERITGLLNHARVAGSHVSPVPVDYNAGEPTWTFLLLLSKEELSISCWIF